MLTLGRRIELCSMKLHKTYVVFLLKYTYIIHEYHTVIHRIYRWATTVGVRFNSRALPRIMFMRIQFARKPGDGVALLSQAWFKNLSSKVFSFRKTLWQFDPRMYIWGLYIHALATQLRKRPWVETSCSVTGYIYNIFILYTYSIFLRHTLHINTRKTFPMMIFINIYLL